MSHTQQRKAYCEIDGTVVLVPYIRTYFDMWSEKLKTCRGCPHLGLTYDDDLDEVFYCELDAPDTFGVVKGCIKNE